MRHKLNPIQTSSKQEEINIHLRSPGNSSRNGQNLKDGYDKEKAMQEATQINLSNNSTGTRRGMMSQALL